MFWSQQNTLVFENDSGTLVSKNMMNDVQVPCSIIRPYDNQTVMLKNGLIHTLPNQQHSQHLGFDMIMVADDEDLHAELDWARQRRKSQVRGVRRSRRSVTSRLTSLTSLQNV